MHAPAASHSHAFHSGLSRAPAPRPYTIRSSDLDTVRVIDPRGREFASIEERRALAEMRLASARGRSMPRIPFVSMAVMVNLFIWGYVAVIVIPSVFGR